MSNATIQGVAFWQGGSQTGGTKIILINIGRKKKLGTGCLVSTNGGGIFSFEKLRQADWGRARKPFVCSGKLSIWRLLVLLLAARLSQKLLETG